MSFARSVLTVYRLIQNALFGRNNYGIMDEGVLCEHDPINEQENHGDVVHPCVRYIDKGYLGHKWWMVYTPYYGSNSELENPILCYSDSLLPPTYWNVAYEIQAKPIIGYNSDPTLFYDDSLLYVIWRENLTKKCSESGNARASFGAIVEETRINNIIGPIVYTSNKNIDSEVSPTFLLANEGSVVCFAMHIRFYANFYQKLTKTFKAIFAKFALILDLLGFWSQQKSYGIAIWKSSSINEPFNYHKTVKFYNCNKLYRPWHMDLFEYNNKIYAIVQTNQCNADICLAESEDGETFVLFKKPLMTNKTCKKIGLYKPTGGVINDMFYLYYTAQEKGNRKLNRMYLSKMNIEEVLRRIR